MIKNVWLRAWLICETLDAVYASVSALLRGKAIGPVWLGVASGPLGDGALAWGTTGVAAGLAVHFAIMAAMTSAFSAVLWRIAWVRHHALAAGTLYGLLLYAVMYGVVLPLRFPANFPLTDPVKIVMSLIPHILCVGWPLAILTSRASSKT